MRATDRARDPRKMNILFFQVTLLPGRDRVQDHRRGPRACAYDPMATAAVPEIIWKKIELVARFDSFRLPDFDMSARLSHLQDRGVMRFLSNRFVPRRHRR